MAIANQTTCDVCGIAKGETNHWLAAIIVTPTEREPEANGILFAPASQVVEDAEEEMPEAKVEDICGQACAHKRLSQWLETLTNPAATERQPA